MYEANPCSADAPFALGVCLQQLGKPDEAEPWLSKALELAEPGARKEHIAQLLDRLRT